MPLRRRLDATKNVHALINATLHRKALTIAKERGETFTQIVERALQEIIYQDRVEKLQRKKP